MRDHRQAERAQDRFLRLAGQQEDERTLDQVGRIGCGGSVPGQLFARDADLELAAAVAVGDDHPGNPAASHRAVSTAISLIGGPRL